MLTWRAPQSTLRSGNEVNRQKVMDGFESVSGPDALDAGVVSLGGDDEPPRRAVVLDRGEQVAVPAATLLSR
jgi:hypothetical protein